MLRTSDPPGDFVFPVDFYFLLVRFLNLIFFEGGNTKELYITVLDCFRNHSPLELKFHSHSLTLLF